MVWRDELSFWTFINKQSSGYLPLIHLGDYYEHHQGDHAKAIEYYKEALDKDPANDFWLYQNIGIVYLLQKDYDRALSCFEHSLLLNPQSPEGYMLKASVHEARNEYDLAFENYSQAIRYNPDFAQAYHNRAIIYCRRGSLNQAIEDLTKAIHLIPDFWTAYYFRGQIYAILGQKNKASDDFNAVLKIKPNDVAAIKYRSLLENNTLPPHRLDIPDDTYDQPQWDSTGYKNYLPDKDRFYKLVS
jgi:tetratricopeptide (TPR) repeat protein